MSEIIIGIDLGTTNSAIACIEEGVAKVIPVDGETSMPSCVGLDLEGNMLVGRKARNQYAVYPDRTILSVKRKMGSSETIQLGEKTYSPEEISSFILLRLKEVAEDYLGQPIKKAVITVPAYFEEAQRKATRDASELAGLEVAHLLNEPTAAALAYGNQNGNKGTTLVYDLGGGTFDASLVFSEAGIIEVKSSHGDTLLGGDDFDRILVRNAVAQFTSEHPSVKIDDDILALSRLKISMEMAKMRLSSEPFAEVEEAFIVDGKSLKMEVARTDYEQEIQPLLDKTIGCCVQCLNDANLRAKDLNRIVLVGGSSRTPLVYELLKDSFGLQPSQILDPDLVVAQGAALQAADIAGVETSRILLDITPHNLGIAALDSMDGLMFTPLIYRNTPLPASYSRVFHTIYDNQEECKIEIYQGAYETLDQNQSIGEFLVTGLGKFPMGSGIIVDFKLNLNGMLEVTALEKRTGLRKSIKVDTDGKESFSDAEAYDSDSDDQIHDLGDAPADEDDLESLVMALKLRVEKLLSSDGLDLEDREEIEEGMEQIEAALKSGERNQILDLKSSLEDTLFFLES